MQRHRLTLLFHEGVIEQLRKLQATAGVGRTERPARIRESNANIQSCFGR